jgi:hypothetical protein
LKLYFFILENQYDKSVATRSEGERHRGIEAERHKGKGRRQKAEGRRQKGTKA